MVDPLTNTCHWILRMFLNHFSHQVPLLIPEKCNICLDNSEVSETLLIPEIGVFALKDI